jgi:hypothetical protein
VGDKRLTGDVLMYILRTITTVKGMPPTEPIWAKTGFIKFHNGMFQDTSADVHVAVGDSVLQANSPHELRLGTCGSTRIEIGLPSDSSDGGDRHVH